MTLQWKGRRQFVKRYINFRSNIFQPLSSDQNLFLHLFLLCCTKGIILPSTQLYRDHFKRLQGFMVHVTVRVLLPLLNWHSCEVFQLPRKCQLCPFFTGSAAGLHCQLRSRKLDKLASLQTRRFFRLGFTALDDVSETLMGSWNFEASPPKMSCFSGKNVG